MKYNVSSWKKVDIIIFSPLENGVMIEPIFMQIVIPNRYVPALILRKWQSLTTIGAKINTTTTSLIIAANKVVIMQRSQKKIRCSPLDNLKSLTATNSNIFESWAILVIILMLRIIIIASHSIDKIKVSIVVPTTKAVIVAAIKQHSREIATKSKLDFE